MIKDGIKRHFSEEQLAEILDILSDNGSEDWHKQKERVKRDAIIISGRSLDMPLSANRPAIIYYRDVPISKNIKKYKT